MTAENKTRIVVLVVFLSILFSLVCVVYAVIQKGVAEKAQEFAVEHAELARENADRCTRSLAEAEDAIKARDSVIAVLGIRQK